MRHCGVDIQLLLARPKVIDKAAAPKSAAFSFLPHSIQKQARRRVRKSGFSGNRSRC
jgi:hypothetical protein